MWKRSILSTRSINLAQPTLRRLNIVVFAASYAAKRLTNVSTHSRQVGTRVVYWWAARHRVKCVRRSWSGNFVLWCDWRWMLLNCPLFVRFLDPDLLYGLRQMCGHPSEWRTRWIVTYGILWAKLSRRWIPARIRQVWSSRPIGSFRQRKIRRKFGLAVEFLDDFWLAIGRRVCLLAGRDVVRANNREVRKNFSSYLHCFLLSVSAFRPNSTLLVFGENIFCSKREMKRNKVRKWLAW